MNPPSSRERIVRVALIWISIFALSGCDQPIRLPLPNLKPANRSSAHGNTTAEQKSPTTEIAGTVIRVMDGDSFRFQSVAGESFDVRLDGIDCPETNQPYGQESLAWLKQITSGRTVWVIPQGKDRYGRVLANVHDRQIWINGELVRRGLAWHYAAFNDDGRLWRLQMDAQAARAGLWQDPSPTPPWEFRKQNPR